jgi:hypothetical protein
MLLASSLLLNFAIIFFLFNVGNLFKFGQNIYKKIVLGYSIFLLITYHLYFVLNLDLQYMLIFWSLVSLFAFIYNLVLHTKNTNNYKPFNLFIITLIFLLSFLYILPALIYGEQFYIFRGNHWDHFSYLSIASLFSEFNYSALTDSEKFPLVYSHFNDINQLIFSRPLTSLVISFYLKIKFIDIFFLSYLFKVALIILSAISFRDLIGNLKISIFNKTFLSITFSLSFWIIYIFEIDAYSHLASLPIFLLIISEINNLQKFKNFDLNFIIFFSILNSSLFLIYPELFCVSTLIVGTFTIKVFFLSNRKKLYMSSVLLTLFIFFILTILSYKTNYIFLFDQLSSSLNQSKDWWGYFGAFIMGKESLVSESSFVLEIKNYFLNNGAFNALEHIIKLHLQNGYNFFYLNIIPSFFGLYYISVGKILNFGNQLNLFIIILLTIYLIYKSYKNIVSLSKNKIILILFVIFFILTGYFLFLGNLWLLIKLYFYLSPFIFIFITTNFYNYQKTGKNLEINYIIILFLILFPVYKYTSSNDGIGKIDSFPSIMHYKMKTNFNWKIELNKIDKCKYTEVVVNDYFKKSYLILKFLHHSIDSNLTNIKDMNLSNKCYLVVEKDGFNLIIDKQ